MTSSIQSNLVHQLARASRFSLVLVHLLQQVSRSQLHDYSSTSIKSIQFSLVELTCQTKNLLHYRHSQDRLVAEKCLLLIEEILAILVSRDRKQSRTNLINLFQSHLFIHSCCFISYSVFYGLVLKHPYHLLPLMNPTRLRKVNDKLLAHINKAKVDNTTLIVSSKLKEVTFEKCEQLINQHIHFYCSQTTQKTNTPTNKAYDGFMKTYSNQSQMQQNSTFSHQQSAGESRNYSNHNTAIGTHISNTTTKLNIPKIPQLKLPISKTNQKSNSRRHTGEDNMARLGGVGVGVAIDGLVDGEMLSRNIVKTGQLFQKQLFGRNPIRNDQQSNQMSSALKDFNILAVSLGQSFISSELGPLLANKRTQQVTELANNLDLQKRLLQKESNPIDSEEWQYDDLDHHIRNSHESGLPERFYKTETRMLKIVMLINVNLITMRVQAADTWLNLHQEITDDVYQLMEAVIIGVIDLYTDNSTLHYRDLNERTRNALKPLTICLAKLFAMMSIWVEKEHLNTLKNRGKDKAQYHYELHYQFQKVTDCNVPLYQGHFHQLSAGPLQSQLGNITTLSDPVVEYLFRQTVEHYATIGLDQQQFYVRQSRLMHVLAFYLSVEQATTSPYVAIDMLFPYLMLTQKHIMETSQNVGGTWEELSENGSKCPWSCCAQSDFQRSRNKIQLNKGQGVSKKKYMGEQHRTDRPLQPLYVRCPSYFSSFLSAMGHCLTNNRHVERLFSLSVLKDQQLMQEISRYLSYLFHHRCMREIEEVLGFYVKAVTIFTKRKERNQDSKTLRLIFRNLAELLNPIDGPIASGLVKRQGLMNPGGFDSEDGHQQDYRFLLMLLKFVGQVYYYGENELGECLLDPDVAGFYIRYSITNFIKLYFYLTVNELMNFDEAATKESAHAHINGSHSLMLALLHILSSISVNRTPEVNKIFRQHRVLEFFIRQLELEFSVAENVDKYLRRHSKLKDVSAAQLQYQQQASKKKQAQPIPKGKGFTLDLSLNLAKLDERKQDSNTNNTMHLALPGLFQQRQNVDQHTIYLSERRVRKIYSNKAIHVESLFLLFSLLLYKGQLDPVYCDQYPITAGKVNALYILGYHLNQKMNAHIVPLIADLVPKMKPYLSGQRLLKLLVECFTNLEHYKDWKKISAGAYGTIYSCRTKIHEPREIAIKKMSLPKSVYERCVLHDIFTQITCLESLRLDERVTTMYNYGISDGSYVIIMKKYSSSLRDWLLEKKANLKQHLHQILQLYLQVLQIVKLLHQQSIVHYDIKADNILLEVKGDILKAVLGDFGECKMCDSDNQLDLRSRGTQCIKSPEMLTLALQLKKEADSYDRRRKIGTTKASDVWSLGCLLYEMLTGQFMFYKPDWVGFYLHVTSAQQELITAEHRQKLHQNVYLIDFLKYILIRDPQHRPSIDHLINRFETLMDLLVQRPPTAADPSPLVFNDTLDQLVSLYQDEGLLLTNRDENMGLLRVNNYQNSQQCVPHSGQRLLKIMEDIYFCGSVGQFRGRQGQLLREGITHVVAPVQSKLFTTLVIHTSGVNTSRLAYQLCARISDMLRQVLLLKGKLLFVNDETNYATNILIFTLSYWFRCSVYETWCLINTQILLFPTFTSDLESLSVALSIMNRIEAHVQSLPKLQCICGSVTIILKKRTLDRKVQSRMCRCKEKNNGSSRGKNSASCGDKNSSSNREKNIASNRQKNNSQQSRDKSESACFSPGCLNYLEFLRARYNVCWDNLKWFPVGQNSLLLEMFSRRRTGQPQSNQRAQIILNSSSPEKNMIVVSGSTSGWSVYQCRICEMWMMGRHNDGSMMVVKNNQIRRIRQGIMIPNAQQQFKMRTPALNYYTLSKLHMTMQEDRQKVKQSTPK